jgi:hypothetical protein
VERAPLTPHPCKHRRDASQRRSELPPELARTPLRDAEGEERGTLLILEINVEISEAGVVVLRNLEGIALVTAVPAS